VANFFSGRSSKKSRSSMVVVGAGLSQPIERCSETAFAIIAHLRNVEKRTLEDLEKSVKLGRRNVDAKEKTKDISSGQNCERDGPRTDRRATSITNRARSQEEGPAAKTDDKGLARRGLANGDQGRKKLIIFMIQRLARPCAYAPTLTAIVVTPWEPTLLARPLHGRLQGRRSTKTNQLERWL
jgi:hypothetical protein